MYMNERFIEFRDALADHPTTTKEKLMLVAGGIIAAATISAVLVIVSELSNTERPELINNPQNDGAQNG